jgi:predicted  nucleic acid-binding Zn-ribbon protein
MDLEEEIRPLKRIVVELEGKVSALEQRMNNQYTATQDLIHRVSEIERALKKKLDAGTF